MSKSPVVAILEECIALHDRKSSDYDHPDSHDGLDNFRESAKLGVPAWVGALVRMSDKWQRIRNLTYKELMLDQGPAVENETIEDTLQDIMVYGGIVLALRRELRAEQVAQTGDNKEAEEKKLAAAAYALKHTITDHPYMQSDDARIDYCKYKKDGFSICGYTRVEHSSTYAAFNPPFVRCIACSHLSHAPQRCEQDSHGHVCGCQVTS